MIQAHHNQTKSSSTDNNKPLWKKSSTSKLNNNKSNNSHRTSPTNSSELSATEMSFSTPDDLDLSMSSLTSYVRPIYDTSDNNSMSNNEDYNNCRLGSMNDCVTGNNNCNYKVNNSSCSSLSALSPYRKSTKARGGGMGVAGRYIQAVAGSNGEAPSLSPVPNQNKNNWHESMPFLRMTIATDEDASCPDTTTLTRASTTSSIEKQQCALPLPPAFQRARTSPYNTTSKVAQLQKQQFPRIPLTVHEETEEKTTKNSSTSCTAAPATTPATTTTKGPKKWGKLSRAPPPREGQVLTRTSSKEEDSSFSHLDLDDNISICSNNNIRDDRFNKSMPCFSNDGGLPSSTHSVKHSKFMWEIKSNAAPPAFRSSKPRTTRTFRKHGAGPVITVGGGGSVVSRNDSSENNVDYTIDDDATEASMDFNDIIVTQNAAVVIRTASPSEPKIVSPISTTPATTAKKETPTTKGPAWKTKKSKQQQQPDPEIPIMSLEEYFHQSMPIPGAIRRRRGLCPKSQHSGSCSGWQDDTYSVASAPVVVASAAAAPIPDSAENSMHSAYTTVTAAARNNNNKDNLSPMSSPRKGIVGAKKTLPREFMMNFLDGDEFAIDCSENPDDDDDDSDNEMEEIRNKIEQQKKREKEEQRQQPQQTKKGEQNKPVKTAQSKTKEEQNKPVNTAQSKTIEEQKGEQDKSILTAQSKTTKPKKEKVISKTTNKKEASKKEKAPSKKTTKTTQGKSKKVPIQDSTSAEPSSHEKQQQQDQQKQLSGGGSGSDRSTNLGMTMAIQITTGPVVEVAPTAERVVQKDIWKEKREEEEKASTPRTDPLEDVTETRHNSSSSSCSITSFSYASLPEAKWCLMPPIEMQARAIFEARRQREGGGGSAGAVDAILSPRTVKRNKLSDRIKAFDKR